MKRSFKSVMALLTAMTMTMGALSVTAYADETETAIAETAPRTETGTFKDGACYTYVLSSGALVINGEGSFTVDEYNALVERVSPTVVIFGKDVIIPQNKKAANEWICSILKMSSDYTVLTFKGSDLDKRRAEMLNALAAEAVKAGKKADAATFSDAFYLYKVDGEINSCEQAIEYFDFPDAVVEKGEKYVNELVEKGIRETIAKKIVAFYCYGLCERIDHFWSYPDGREKDEDCEKYFSKKVYDTAKSEQDVIDSTDEENLTFDNAISDFLSDNGFAQNDVYSLTRLYAIGSKLAMAFDLLTGGGIRPDDLAEAYNKDYEEKYVKPYISPDLTDIDMVLEYRGKWLRFKLGSSDSYDEESIDEVVKDYLTGLKLRIEEGLAKETGQEINDETEAAFLEICRQNARTKRSIEFSSDEQRIENLKKTHNKNKKLLLSDYTVNTEDSKTKYINSEGDYVKCEVYTENDGVLPSGVEYHYNPNTKAIFLDGDGTFTMDENSNLSKNFPTNIYIMGKNVKFSEEFNWIITEDGGLNFWIDERCLKDGIYKLYTYADSYTKKAYDADIDWRIEHADGCSYGGDIEDGCTDRAILEDYFHINIIGEDEDPYDILSGGKKNVPKDAKQTLRGDADVNGEVSLSDVIAVTKYTVSNASYPLENDTAYANADMNDDRIIDSRDTSALIEVNLGK